MQRTAIKSSLHFAARNVRLTALCGESCGLALCQGGVPAAHGVSLCKILDADADGIFPAWTSTVRVANAHLSGASCCTAIQIAYRAAPEAVKGALCGDFAVLLICAALLVWCVLIETVIWWQRWWRRRCWSFGGRWRRGAGDNR